MSGLFRSGLRAFGKYVIRPLFSKAARPYHNYIELNSKMYRRKPSLRSFKKTFVPYSTKKGGMSFARYARLKKGLMAFRNNVSRRIYKRGRNNIRRKYNR